MPVPHRDDPAISFPRRPDHHDESSLNVARSDVSPLAVVTPVIRLGKVAAPKHLPGVRKIQASLDKRSASLFLIPRDRH
jgi:hypothetical protein